MSAEEAARWARVKAIVLDALEQPEAERRSFLTAACDGDVDLQEESERLLSRRGHSALQGSDPLGIGVGRGQAPGLREGDRLGDFTLRHPIAEGGSSVIYLATQDDPQREVALKVQTIRKPSAEQRWRFHQEADLLARLQHPSIARVLKAGEREGEDVTTCWIAVELLRPARDLIGHLDGCSRSQVLHLMIELCEAVQYGHRQGVLHRDLKPANILIGEDGRPCLIDFGIAKCLAQAGEGRDHPTREGQFFGTLTHASPEQVSGDPAAIDTRSDVYSLGVLLHQALVGALPIAVEGRPLAEALQAIRSEEPSKKRLAAAGLSTELQAVVLRALAKQPDDRYPSAEALADDLRCVLAGRSVRARRSSWLRHSWLFTRRHARRLLASCVLLAFVGGGALWQWRRSQDQAERLAAQEAYGEGHRDVLQRLISLVNPRESGLAAVENEMLLNASGIWAEELLAGMPVALIEVHSALATSFQGLGNEGRALQHWRRVVELANDTSELSPASRIRMRIGLASALIGVGKEKEAREGLLTAVGEAGRLAQRGSEAEALLALATVDYGRGEHKAARSSLDASLVILRQQDDTRFGPQALQLHGYLLQREGEPAKATLAFREAIDLLKRGSYAQAALLASLRGNLATAIHDDEPVEAEQIYRAALPYHAEVLGPKNENLPTLLAGLGNVLRAQERRDEADPYLRRALMLIHEELEGRHPHALSILGSYLGLLYETGRVKEARPFILRAREIAAPDDQAFLDRVFVDFEARLRAISD